MIDQKKSIVWFQDVDKDDVGLVGGKGANLGEITKAGFPMPPGFIVTAGAYFDFLEYNNFLVQIKRILKPCNIQDPRQLNEASARIKALIKRGKIPDQLAKLIIQYYEKLGGPLRSCLVAARSSATAEDLPDASFAGQQETFLNIKGEANVVNKVRECWASLFTPRAIFYREEKKFDHFKVGIAVVVQKMIQSQTSGIMFTVDPVTNNKERIIIEAIYGLGELIVQGSVTPDHYQVDKNNFQILIKQVSEQKLQLIKQGAKTLEIKVPEHLSKKQKISDSHIVEIAKFGKRLHQHYFFPQDIEWGIEKNKVYILQTRPVTTLVKKGKKKKKAKKIKISLPLLLTGDAASPGMASGFVHILKSAAEISKLKAGEILVTRMTTPDFVPAMKRAAAIVTDEGGQTSHAAIVSRELGIPCVVGTKKATQILKTGMMITVDAKEGKVTAGGLTDAGKKMTPTEARKEPEKLLKISAAEINFTDATNLKTATKLYVNLAEPDLAATIGKRDVDGVGLLRAEFMISEYIKYHPKKLISDGKKKIFVDKLAEGMERFCRAFNPRPVVYRATDFKTNEYANLIGGKQFEPEEPNPMIGYRGAFRYINDQQVFKLELEAILRVREKFDLKNLLLMIPFVRTVDEYAQVKKIVNKAGLSRQGSFDLWMMVEIPSNVVLLEDFIEVGLDGISIGSNDLTMLVLGADRDNEELAKTFDERNKAVLWFLEKAIKTCNKHGVTSSICGQAPSIYPDLTAKLVKWGITSVSVSPDMIETTRQIIYEAEKRRVSKK